MSLRFRQPVLHRRVGGHRHTSRRLAFASLTVILQAILCASPAPAQNFGEWGPAVSVDPFRLAGINTPVNDGCPIEAPDGLTLFFATSRAGSLDIWTASRQSKDADWTDPAPLPAPVNTLANDFCPTPLPGNRLLFVSTRGNSCGGVGNNPDIYYTRQDSRGVWDEPQPLSCAINSGGQEFSPSLVEAEGQTMLFFSSDQGTPGRQAIFVAVLQTDGTWEQAQRVAELNSPAGSDARPNVRKDGLEIVFDSTRDQLSTGPVIYSATRASVFAPWSQPVPLSDTVNFPGQAQSRPTISRDGRRLYFGSTLANQLLGGVQSDIYVSMRSGPAEARK